MAVHAIILARGGSKGIPAKNRIDFCGKPLLSWTVEQCCAASCIDGVWVSSDSQELLDIAVHSGAEPIERPAHLAGDTATSEAGWLHAIGYLKGMGHEVEIVVAPQVTSPLREPGDFDGAVQKFRDEALDSLFSCSPAGDLCLWQQDDEGQWQSINYDYKVRKRRQEFGRQYIENGSFYLFKPAVLEKYGNRFGGKLGAFEMASWKAFEIDEPEDVRFCSVIMKEYLLG